MKLNFLGGAGTVTGSLYILEYEDYKIAIDCGIEQESYTEKEELIQKYKEKIERMPCVDLLILTHAHLDHSGLIPLAVKKGKIGKILSTEPTRDLAFLLFNDTIKIMNNDVFNREDINKTLFLWETIDYLKEYKIESANITIKLYDASHIIGSASTLIMTPQGNILFSGDIGSKIQNLVSYPPLYPKEDVHYLVIESTYGGKERKDIDEKEIVEKIKSVIERKGKILFPVFAIGRLQEILYLLTKHKIDDIVEIYVDTPMGNTVTELCDKYVAYLPPSIRKKIDVSLSFNIFGGKYKVINTNNQSVSLLEKLKDKPAIILSASGMLEGGRVLNHLKHIIEDEKNAIFFVGYQANGTRGRKILDGEESVKCEVFQIQDFSAHADKNELLDYVKNLKYYPYKIFIVHGEDEQREEFAKELNKMKIRTEIPKLNESFEISSMSCFGNGNKIKINIPLEWVNIKNTEMAPLCSCWLVKTENGYEINDVSWFSNLFYNQEFEAQKLSVVKLFKNEIIEMFKEVDVEEIEVKLPKFKEMELLSNKMSKEFYEKLSREGEKSAQQYIIEKHRKNENTGKRRWNIPAQLLDYKDEEEAYEDIYNVLMSMTKLPLSQVYVLLKKAGAKI